MLRSVSRTAAALGVLAMLGVAHAEVKDDGKPVNAAIPGAAAGGTFSVAGESIAQIVRKEYPGSAVTYEPGNNAGSLVGMLEGRTALATAHCTGEVQAALGGEAPFPKAYPKANYYTVANLLNGDEMVGVIYARKDFVDEHGIKSLADVKAKKIPIRYSTNQLGNVSTVRHGRFVLEAYGMSDDAIAGWGGRNYHLPDAAGVEQLKDGKLDLIVTLGFHPDRRILEAARSTELVLIPMDPAVAQQVAAKMHTKVGTIKANAYPFVQQEHKGATMGGCFLAAGPEADEMLTYKLAKALYTHFDDYKAAHPAFRSMEREMLVAVEPYPLHPGAAQFYREVGLIK